MPNPLSPFAQRVLDTVRNADANLRYGEVASALGLPARSYGRAIGSALRAIHAHGFHDQCVKVVNHRGEHGCDQPPQPRRA